MLLSTSRWRTAVVIGASSGMGAAIAGRLAADGVRVALVARRERELADLTRELQGRHGDNCATYRAHDVTDFDAVPAVWTSLEEELGGIDLVVFAAGVMPDVGPSEFTFAKDRKMIEVNVLGAMAWLNQAALRMEAARQGSIVAVSSVAGDRGRYGNPAYTTSKAALNTFMESLRNRLWRHGVRVTTVRPGFVYTPMTEHLDLPGAMTISADRAAELIIKAAAKSKTDVYVPARWALVMFIIRSIPSVIFRRLKV